MKRFLSVFRLKSAYNVVGKVMYIDGEKWYLLDIERKLGTRGAGLQEGDKVIPETIVLRRKQVQRYLENWEEVGDFLTCAMYFPYHWR